MFKMLLEYLPNYLRDFVEMSAITAAEEPELLLVQSQLEQVLANQFIDTADTDTIERMEKMFNVPVQPDATLDDRRFSVKATLNQAAPFTYRSLCNQLEALCGADGYSVDLLPNYNISIRIGLARKNNYNAAQEMVERVLPCNLVLDMSLLYNQHSTLAHYTHAQLSNYTHYGVRNDETLAEVI